MNKWNKPYTRKRKKTQARKQMENGKQKRQRKDVEISRQ